MTDREDDLLIELGPLIADRGRLSGPQTPSCNDRFDKAAGQVQLALGSLAKQSVIILPESFFTEKGNLGSSPMLPRINASDQATPGHHRNSILPIYSTF